MDLHGTWEEGEGAGSIYATQGKSQALQVPGKVFATKTIIVLSVQDCRLEICGDIDLHGTTKVYLGQIQCDEQ